jgi:Domain of unknown function (DUF4112)
MQATMKPTTQPTMDHSFGQPQRVTQRVNTRRVRPGLAGLRRVTTLDEDLKMARGLAKLMDAQFRLGPIKFGLDSLVGLVPVAGDLVGLAAGLYPIHLARKHGLGKLVIGKMVMNLGIDFVGGLVPVAGDALDLVFKAQLKNLKILEAALDKRRRT